MSLVQQLRRYPFLRLLLPLICGIVLTDYLYFQGIVWQEVHLLFPLLMLLCLLIVCYLKNYLHHCWGIFVTLFFFLLGTGLTATRLNQTAYPFPDEPVVYRALIETTPETKSNSIFCSAYLLEGCDSLPFPVAKKVLLYFSPDSASRTIKRGDEVIFRTQLSLPRNNGNPDEFDYPRYLLRKGVSATGFVAADNWKQTHRSSPTSLQETAFNCRDYILEQYKNLRFSDEEFAVLSALTLGYKDELSEDIRESFSVSGVAHVLALSGLHVGFIFGILFFLFNRCFGSSEFAVLFRTVVIVLLLWSFAFITGLSPSVVRSVFMFSLLAFSFLRADRPLTIHLLTVAAFCMLLYNPAWLFDVGFQLSYVAVLGIVLLQPVLYRLLVPGNLILKYLWGIVTVSLAAQIATAPLTVFYFSRFPVYFLFANIAVIPLVTLIIPAAVGMLALSTLPWMQQPVVWVLQFLIDSLNHSVRWIEQLPHSSIQNIWVDHWGLFAGYLLLLAFAGLIINRRKWYLFVLLGCLLFTTAHQLWIKVAEPPHCSIAFYNVRNCPVVHCIAETGDSWLVYADTLPDTGRLNKQLSGYWNRRRLGTPVPVTTDHEDSRFIRKDDMLLFHGKRLCLLSDNRWDHVSGNHSLNIDYLYICKGFTRNLESLTSLFTIGCVVMDASLPAYRRELLIAECDKLNITYKLLSEKAFIVRCD